jgi:hypothetical protein
MESSENENWITIQNETCEIYLNEIVMEEEIMEERSQESSILQTKSSRGWKWRLN